MTARTRVVTVAHALAAVCLAVGGLLAFLRPDDYYRLVQEDELLEWSTFWCFVVAGVLHARWGRGRPLRARWFSLGLALFCWLVALEPRVVCLRHGLLACLRFARDRRRCVDSVRRRASRVLSFSLRTARHWSLMPRSSGGRPGQITALSSPAYRITGLVLASWSMGM